MSRPPKYNAQELNDLIQDPNRELDDAARSVLTPEQLTEARRQRLLDANLKAAFIELHQKIDQTQPGDDFMLRMRNLIEAESHDRKSDNYSGTVRRRELLNFLKERFLYSESAAWRWAGAAAMVALLATPLVWQFTQGPSGEVAVYDTRMDGFAGALEELGESERPRVASSTPEGARLSAPAPHSEQAASEMNDSMADESAPYEGEEIVDVAPGSPIAPAEEDMAADRELSRSRNVQSERSALNSTGEVYNEASLRQSVRSAGDTEEKLRALRLLEAYYLSRADVDQLERVRGKIKRLEKRN